MDTDKIQSALSASRLATYHRATKNVAQALELYVWNAHVSGAFFPLFQVCEVALRNSISAALDEIYGVNWPWSLDFEQDLPPKSAVLNGLISTRNKKENSSTGKVIAELKLMFWQRMFTKRHDQRLLKPYFNVIMPGYTFQKGSASHIAARKDIYSRLDCIRVFRNRIAHHEPVFKRKLHQDYNLVLDMVGYCSPATRHWIEHAHGQYVLQVLNEKP